MAGSVFGIAAALVVASLSSGAAVAEPLTQVEVDHAAARLVVIAEPRGDISVAVNHGSSALPPLSVRREDGRIVVDGGLGGPWRQPNCVGGLVTDRGPAMFGETTVRLHDTRAVRVNGVGRVPYAELPVITAHVPLDARIAASGAVWGVVGATRSLSVAASGCGDWTAGRVQGPFDVHSQGSGDIQAADVGLLRAALSGSGDVGVGQVAGSMDVALHGSGDVKAGAVGGMVRLALAGSGDVSLASVAGPIQAHLSGSSDVHIHGGHAPQVQVNVSGSGDFDFAGVAGGLQAAVAGSGDVHVARVDGPINKSVAGPGDVRVGP